jgi:hypothetical protein
MPQFMTVHRAPGLKPDEVEQNIPQVLAAKTAVFKQLYVNLGTGFLVSIFEAENKEKLEEQLEMLGFPIDESHEINFAASRLAFRIWGAIPRKIRDWLR